MFGQRNSSQQTKTGQSTDKTCRQLYADQRFVSQRKDKARKSLFPQLSAPRRALGDKHILSSSGCWLQDVGMMSAALHTLDTLIRYMIPSASNADWMDACFVSKSRSSPLLTCPPNSLQKQNAHVIYRGVNEIIAVLTVSSLLMDCIAILKPSC